MTPLPVRKLAIVSFIFFANNASIWMIFSFLPSMVMYYYPRIDPTEVGYFAGILGSAFSLGSLCGNFLWGVLADRLGRRVVMLSGLLGTTICATMFGLSPNYWTAVFARFFWGIFNGNIGVVNTYVAEIHDDSNFAKGMAIFGAVGGLGRAMGPVIGGALAQPAFLAHFKGNFIERFPFVLPSLVIVVFCLFVFIFAYIELSETLSVYSPVLGSEDEDTELQNSKLSNDESLKSIDLILVPKDKEGGLEMGNLPFLRSLQYLSPSDHMQVSTDSELYRSPDFVPTAECDGDIYSSRKNDVSRRKRLTFNGIVEMHNLETGKCEYATLKTSLNDNPQIEVNDIEHGLDSKDFHNPKIKYSNGSEQITGNTEYEYYVSWWRQLRYFIRTKIIVISIVIYGLLSLINVVAVEVFPLWLALPTYEGGFGFTSFKIGLLVTISGSVNIISQLLIYPTLVETYGTLHIFRLGIIAFLLSALLLSFCTEYFMPNMKILLIILVSIGNCVLTASAGWCFICVFVFINNSCYSHQRGKVNGLGQSFASIGRIVGPICGTSIFAWTSHQSRWPLNDIFVWYFVAFGAFCIWRLSTKLPKKIVKRRREPQVPRYAMSMMKNQMNDDSTI